MEDEELDLSGVHPLLWERTRARVNAIRDFLALEAPEAADVARYADRLGISSTHFRTLVRTWRQHRKASALPGTSFDAWAHPQQRGRLENQVAKLLSLTIGELGTDAPATEIHEELQRRCRQRGLDGPSLVTVRLHLSRARKTAGPLPALYEDPAMIIDHTAIELPIRRTDGRIVLPVLTFAILVPELVIVAHEVAASPPSPLAAAAVLRRALAITTPTSPSRSLKMSFGRTEEWRLLQSLVQNSGASLSGRTAPRIPSGRDAFRLLNGQLDDLKLRPNLTHRPHAAAARMKLGERAMRERDVEVAIGNAVDRHNSSLGQDLPDFTIMPERSRSRLATELAQLAF
jgi:hypothetical protein